MNLQQELANKAEILADMLLASQAHLVTAESCTGGGLAELLTRIPGSSRWFECGLVTYSNASKMTVLNVQEKSLHDSGAVSERVADEMAKGAWKNYAGTISVSITGIAGPTGGTVEKPVGTVCLSCSDNQNYSKTIRCLLTGDREEIRDESCLMALDLLIERLQELD